MTTLTAKYKPYSAYKPSDVEWLGDIPAHWEVKKATRLFSIGSGTTPPTGNSEYYGGEIAWITTSELRESVVTSTEKTINDEALRLFPALNVHPVGSVAVAMYGATIGRLGILGIPATVNQACCVFSEPNGIETWFWFYWLQCRRHYLISMSYGGGQPNLSQEILKSLRVPVPSLDEQRAIAAFLDRETARIDELVARMVRLIELLLEKRTALITRVVTRGLDLNAPMKNSGVEWLGEIPAHWEVKRLKYLADFINGAAFNPAEWGTEGTPIIRIQNLNGGDDFNYTTRKLPIRYVSQAGDLLFGWSGNRGTSFGPFLWWRQGEYYVNQHIFRVFPVNVTKEWFYWALKAVTFHVERQAHGIIGMVHITRDELGTIYVPFLPCIWEQRSIADFLDREAAKLDALIAKVREAIDRLKELRTALISAAVTGRIDVREEAG